MFRCTCDGVGREKRAKFTTYLAAGLAGCLIPSTDSRSFARHSVRSRFGWLKHRIGLDVPLTPSLPTGAEGACISAEVDSGDTLP